MSSRSVEVEGLTKKFGWGEGILALQDVSFSVDGRTIFGLLGSDGAGKSTLLRILATLLTPTKGRVRIGDLDLVSERNRVKRLVGYAAKNPALHRRMSILKHLEFWSRVDGLSRAERAGKIGELMAFLELEDVAQDKVLESTASTQSNVFLAQTLLSDPDVILLDEPLVGFSASERDSYVQKLEVLRRDGKTIIMSSSKLEDVHSACSQLVVLSEGRGTRTYETDELLKAIGRGRHARIFVTGEAVPEKVRSALANLAGVTDVRQSEASIILYVDPGSFNPDEIQGVLEGEGVKQYAVKRAEITLGDVFRALSDKKES